jgi:hypothetical protein
VRLASARSTKRAASNCSSFLFEQLVVLDEALITIAQNKSSLESCPSYAVKISDREEDLLTGCFYRLQVMHNANSKPVSVFSLHFVAAPAADNSRQPKGQRGKYIGILKSGQNYRINRFNTKIDTDVQFNLIPKTKRPQKLAAFCDMESESFTFQIKLNETLNTHYIVLQEDLKIRKKLQSSSEVNFLSDSKNLHIMLYMQMI